MIKITYHSDKECRKGCHPVTYTDLTATDAVNLLTELEGVIKYIQENNTEVVTEYPL